MNNWLLKTISFFSLVVGTVYGAELGLSNDRIEGRLLAAELNEQRPSENLLTTGMLEVRNDEGQRRKIPIRMEITASEDSWKSRYETAPIQEQTGESVIIIHRDSEPTIYHYVKQGSSKEANPVILTGEAAAISFAGTDFWICDLGLDFFQWPEQRLVRKEMRRGRSCRVLESTNPNKDGKYARVLSWIDYETHGLVRAEAYNSQNKLIKEFALGGIKKINGKWQLKDLEIINYQNESRTKLLFDLQIKDKSSPNSKSSNAK